MNSTHFPYLVLAAYFDTGPLRYFFFLVLLLLYVSIVCANVLLILVICLNRSLHEPMYVFLCSLFVNELYGSAGLFPFLLLQILSDLHHVSSSLCFLQIFCLYSYTCVEFFTLAVMSYDRFLAICCPLHYNSRMTARRVAWLIAVAWATALLIVLGTTTLSSSLRLCGNVINTVYCINYSILRLVCSSSRVSNIYGLFVSAASIIVPLVLIFFSYVRILKVCFSGSRQTWQKAVSTCYPHLASLLNFAFGVCFEVLQSRFQMSSVPSVLQIILSLYFFTCQPLLNPLLYGLRLSKIRNICKSLLGLKF